MRVVAWVPLLLLLVPAAQAEFQVTALEFGPGQFLVPGSDSGNLTATATLTCGPTETWGSQDGATLTISATPPDGITVLKLDSVTVPATACVGPASMPWKKDLAFPIKAATSVAGLRSQSIPFTFSIAAKGTAPAFSASQVVSVKTDFVGKIEASFVNATATTDHAQAHFALKLRNAGNAVTAVTVLAPDPALKGVVVVTPAESVLNVGDSTTVPILVTLGKDAPASVDIPLRILNSANEDRSKHGPEVHLTGTVRVGSDGLEEQKKSSPAAPLLFAVGALGLAAVARRRQA